MFLQRLRLSDFRNYERLELNFEHNLNILAGENAQGKTNVLEAIAFTALSKSPRTVRDADLVRWKAPQAWVYAEIARQKRGPVSIDITLLSSGRKLIKVNEVTRRRLNEVIGQVNVVMFGPQDLTIVSGDPSQRRHFLNLAIAQTSREYYYNLAQYRKVLRQRNSLLKSLEGQLNRAELLDPWDEQLLHYGARLMEIRCRVVAQLAEKAQQTHYHLANGQEELTVRYGPSFDLQGATTAEELAQVFQAELQRRREEEIRRGVTLIGPHRDDLLLEVNGLEARLYASQGQQRTAAIALKLAELSLIREWIGESPLLLLDDVMSELDDRRRRQVMALTDDVEQIFITCSQKSTFSQAILRRAGLFQVHAGTITPVPLG